MLDPPAQNGPWPAFAAVDRLGREDPGQVVAWLERMYDRHKADSTRCWFVARAAVDLGATALSLVLRALRDHGPSPALASLGVWAVERADATSDLVESLADILLNGPAWRSAGYAEPVLQQLARGLNKENAARRLQLLCWKLGAVTEDEGGRRWFEYERAGSIAESGDDDPDDRFGALLKALVTALQRSWEWLTIDQVLAVVDSLPDEVRVRVRAWLLASAPGVELDAMIDELARAMSEREPTGDDLAVMDRVVAAAAPAEYEQRWGEALGDAPSVVDVAHALAARELSPAVRRGVHWAGIFPGKVGEA